MVKDANRKFVPRNKIWILIKGIESDFCSYVEEFKERSEALGEVIGEGFDSGHSL